MIAVSQQVYQIMQHVCNIKKDNQHFKLLSKMNAFMIDQNAITAKFILFYKNKGEKSDGRVTQIRTGKNLPMFNHAKIFGSHSRTSAVWIEFKK